MYSKLTPKQKDEIVQKFRESLGLATDILHAVAIASTVIRKKFARANTMAEVRHNEEAFAAALATLAMRKEIILSKGFYRVENKPGKVEYKQHGPPS